MLINRYLFNRNVKKLNFNKPKFYIMDENVNYVFKKDYVTHGAIVMFKKNSEFRFFRGFCYFNGGMVQPSYVDILKKFVTDPKLKEEYIKEEPLIYNKV